MKYLAHLSALLGGLSRLSPLVRRARLNKVLLELAITEATGAQLAKENATFRLGIDAQKRALSRSADDIERLKEQARHDRLTRETLDGSVDTLRSRVADLESKLHRCREGYRAIYDAIDATATDVMSGPEQGHRPEPSAGRGTHWPSRPDGQPTVNMSKPMGLKRLDP